MYATDVQREDRTLARSRPAVRHGAGPGPVDPRLVRDPGAMMRLQRSAGNDAVQRLVTGRHPVAVRPRPVPVQRQPETSGAAPASEAGGQSWAKGPVFGPATPVAEAEVGAKVDAIIAAMGSTATTVIPYSPPAVAANEPSAGAPTAQTAALPDVVQRSGALASLQRSGGGGASGEGGVVGSAQICYNLCSGEVSLVGWLWAGAGVKLWGGWYGAYYFWEGSRVIGQLDHLTCGTCSAACGGGHEKGSKESGWGLGGFPVVVKPGDWARFKKLGLEVGLLITPHSFCDADLEVIALFDLLEYVPSFKPPLTAAEKAAAVLGIHLECGLGIDVSGSVHLCKDDQGHTTADNAKVCAGAFIGCGVGLSHDKGSLPGGQHPVPA